MRKGSQLYIEGSLRNREWEKDGAKHYATDIVANEVKMLGKRETTVSVSAPQIADVTYSDDLPY